MMSNNITAVQPKLVSFVILFPNIYLLVTDGVNYLPTLKKIQDCICP